MSKKYSESFQSLFVEKQPYFRDAFHEGSAPSNLSTLQRSKLGSNRTSMLPRHA